MNKITTSIIGIILIAVAFYGGMKYDQQTVANARSARSNQFGGIGGANGRGFGGRGGGFSMGTILSKDAQSITIQLTSTSTPSLGSAIIFFSASTTITKIAPVSPTNLVIGQNITVVGVKNTDGSINATSIQIRDTQ